MISERIGPSDATNLMRHAFISNLICGDFRKDQHFAVVRLTLASFQNKWFNGLLESIDSFLLF